MSPSARIIGRAYAKCQALGPGSFRSAVPQVPARAAMLRSRAMRRLWALAFVLVVAAAGCGREQWPSPPPVDAARYQEDHAAWLADERAYLSEVLPIIGIWPLADGETSFGADPALPVSLSSANVPPRAGVFRRVGDTVTVIPTRDFALYRTDGTRVEAETQADSILAGPFRMEITDVGDDRRWVAVIDTTHPAITAPPPLPLYPLDERWRVAARL